MNKVIVWYLDNTGNRVEFKCTAADPTDAENQCKASAGDDIEIILVKKDE